MHRNELFWVLFFIICLASAISACASSGVPAESEKDSANVSAESGKVSAGASAMSSEDAPAGASAMSENASAETKTIRIIGTSDLHGKFVPWDYALNQESLSGSVAQLSTAIKEYRTENTLLMDAGDSIQDNSAEIFLSGDEVHPMIQDTPLMDLINRVQMYYADAAVSAAPLSFAEANLYPGDIRKCDTSQIYKFNNTLYKIHMNGGQLKKYMERSAEYFNTFQPGDTTISINPDMPDYLYHMFEGVNYEIDISLEPGSRIENLTWPDGTPVQEGDEFNLAINNYSAVSELLAPGVIYEEGELPRLVDIDIHSEIGGLRELIRDYIVNVKHGTIKPEVNGNWRITGDDT